MAIESQVIISAHAIIDPRAMMIKSVNASIAYIAMSAPYTSNDLTKWTELGRFKRFQKS